MNEIDLIKSRLRYDPGSGNLYWISMRHNLPQFVGKKAGWIQKYNNQRMICIRIKKKSYLAHRLAFLLQTGVWPKNHIDHKNGDSTDNRWTNLREATAEQNSWNRPLISYKKSGLPMGVRQKRNTFEVRITKNKKQFQVGTFKTLELAVAEYIKAKKELHGEFASRI